ncbi:lysophospholipid acyltransferase family protein [Nitratifractor sp.]
MSDSIRHTAEYWGARSLLAATRLLPRRATLALSRGYVRSAFSPDSSRFARVLEHLAIAFPEMEEAQRLAVAREYLEHKAAFYAEVVWMLTDRIDYDASVVNRDEAVARIEALKRRNERGMVFLVSHFGNWEFLAQFFAVHGLPGTLVAKAQHKSPLIDERIITPYRRRFGHRVIPREGALRQIARILRAREGVGMHIDQMIPPPNGVKIEFFSREAYASAAMARLKLRFDPLMVPIFAVREAPGRFRIEIGEPVEYTAEEIEDENARIVAITQRYTDILEAMIRRHPAQWEWSYKRWRMPGG